MTDCVLGIDLGTSSVKVTAVTRTGKIIAQEQMDFPISQPQPGYAEQDPEDWVSATTVSIVRLILQTSSSRNRLLVLAIPVRCTVWCYWISSSGLYG